MESQKRENILNLALEATGEERERSIELDVGLVLCQDLVQVKMRFSSS